MGSFKLGKMTLGSMFKKPETVQYPAETKPIPEGLKGHIEITIEDCILCGICMKCCPTDAIVVDKPAATWSINRFRCVQCGSCVRECPKTCLRMEPTYTCPSTQKSVITVVQEQGGEEEKAAKKAKDEEKAARIKAAKEAKAAQKAGEA